MVDSFSSKRFVDIRHRKPNIMYEENTIHWYFDLEPSFVVAYLSKLTPFFFLPAL